MSEAATAPALELGRAGQLQALCRAAIASGRTLLAESDARHVLQSYGIPMSAYRVARTEREAVAGAIEIGFPVALKAMVPGLVHKTEAGAVHLNLAGADEVREALARARETLSTTPEGYIVEAMAPSGLDLCVGVTDSKAFGPVVGLGLGGTLVEFYGAMEFRHIPVDAVDARRLVGSPQLRLESASLRHFRIAYPAALENVLMQVGGPAGIIAQSGGMIKGLELNPLRVIGSRVVSLDVKIALSRPQAGGPFAHQAGGPLDLSPLFRPRSIAFYGASQDAAKIGTRILQSMRDFGFEGAFHVVHPTATKILGLPCVRSLAEVSGPVDYAYIAVPKLAVKEAIRDCAGRVRFAHILTSGFGEMGERGAQEQREMLDAARSGNVRLVGPNCIGAYCPSGKVTCIENASPEVGRVAFISQSGGLATDAIRQGPTLGIHFSKVVSIGNCADLEASDFLEYLAADPETSVIGIYLEAVREGPRFLAALRTARKRGLPVVMLKGGRSTSGGRAAALHTGSVATEHGIWSGVLRQHGAVLVESFEDLMHMLAFLQSNALPTRANALIVTQGGGATVLIADECDAEEVALPALEPQTSKALIDAGFYRSLVPDNPLDSPVGIVQIKDGRALGEIVDIILTRQEYGVAILQVNLQNVYSYTANPDDILQNLVVSLGEVQRQRGVPIISIFRSNGELEIERARLKLQTTAAAFGITPCANASSALRVVKAAVDAAVAMR